MNKKILSEINQAKYLFDHKRGVVISEQNKVDNLIKSILNEAPHLPCIQNGDGLCKIMCLVKQAKKGCPKSKEVQEIQHALAKSGMYKGEGGGMSTNCAKDVNACDGIFDWRTKKAVEEFQTANKGLTVDGAVGANTLAKLIPGLNCNCKKEQDGGGGRYGGGGNSSNTECEKIISCLRYITDKRNIDAFLDCINMKPKDNNKDLTKAECPEYIDCITSTIKQRDSRCDDKSFKERCPKTKITY